MSQDELKQLSELLTKAKELLRHSERGCPSYIIVHNKDQSQFDLRGLDVYVNIGEYVDYSLDVNGLVKVESSY